MPLLPDLRTRRRRPEIMDGPDLDPVHHRQALRGLARINFWSASAGILWPPLADLARRHPGRPLRVLDVATGGGDIPLRLLRRARRAGLPMEVHGCDVSPTALAACRAARRRTGLRPRFFPCDVFRDALPSGYDAVVSSLFLHHLDEDDAVTFLRRAGEAAGRLVLVNDLVRGSAGYALAWVGTRVLSRSPVVHVDGPRSVEGAFTYAEARALAERAGLSGAEVTPRWPCRFLLTWRRPE